MRVSSIQESAVGTLATRTASTASHGAIAQIKVERQSIHTTVCKEGGVGFKMLNIQ